MDASAHENVAAAYMMTNSVLMVFAELVGTILQAVARDVRVSEANGSLFSLVWAILRALPSGFRDYRATAVVESEYTV